MSSTAASAAGSLRVITGPTAAGKSAIALHLAERCGATIISADSRQIYRGFDIGTAKPTAAEQARVPHRGIDVAEPTERYSAAAWAAAADGWIAEARAAGREPLVVGGTGFYLRALVEPLFEEPLLDPARRAALERLLAGQPTEELRRWVRALDPARAHLGRTQLLRAIEVALLAGARISDLHRDRPRPPRHSARYLVVDPGARLRGRIAARVQQMLDAGWEDEVRRLIARVPAGAPAWKSTGYDLLRRLVLGEVARAEAIERIVIDTRQYAKRQRTWLRHQLPAALVTHVDPDAAGWEAVVERWWNGADTGTRRSDA